MRERARMQTGKGQREREGENPQRALFSHLEPDVGLELRNYEIMT